MCGELWKLGGLQLWRWLWGWRCGAATGNIGVEDFIEIQVDDAEIDAFSSQQRNRAFGVFDSDGEAIAVGTFVEYLEIVFYRSERFWGGDDLLHIAAKRFGFGLANDTALVEDG